MSVGMSPSRTPTFHELVEGDFVARDFKGELLERVVIEAYKGNEFQE